MYPIFLNHKQLGANPMTRQKTPNIDRAIAIIESEWTGRTTWLVLSAGVVLKSLKL